MKTLIYARVVAKPTHFPDVIEMIYHCLDKQDTLTGETLLGGPFSWDEVKHRFWIDVSFAQECEEYFRKGESVFLGNKEVELLGERPK